jgi:hypothetical protein
MPVCAEQAVLAVVPAVPDSHIFCCVADVFRWNDSFFVVFVVSHYMFEKQPLRLTHSKVVRLSWRKGVGSRTTVRLEEQKQEHPHEVMKIQTA